MAIILLTVGHVRPLWSNACLNIDVLHFLLIFCGVDFDLFVCQVLPVKLATSAT